MNIEDDDLQYLFDAIWYQFNYHASIEFRVKLYELAIKYNYEPIIKVLKKSGYLERVLKMKK